MPPPTTQGSLIEQNITQYFDIFEEENFYIGLGFLHICYQPTYWVTRLVESLGGDRMGDVCGKVRSARLDSKRAR